MANIAVIFHWAPPVMDAMSLTELMGWHEEARRRSGSDR